MNILKYLKMIPISFSVILLYFVALNILSNSGETLYIIRTESINYLPLGVLIFTLIVSLSVILPLLNSSIALITILTLGQVWGFIAYYIGSLLGSIINFYIFRRYGRKAIIEKFPLLADNMNIIAKKMGFLAMTFFRMFPALPFDAISYLFSFSQVKFRNFVIATLLGLIPPALSYSFVGYQLESNGYQRSLINVVLGFFVILVVVFLIRLFGKNLNMLDSTDDNKDSK